MSEQQQWPSGDWIRYSKSTEQVTDEKMPSDICCRVPKIMISTQNHKDPLLEHTAHY